MKDAPTILVATEVSSDADLVRKLLSDEFDQIVVSTDPEYAVQDFEKHRPKILILAFNTLEKAERYYLGLYRLSAMVHALPHRTLILCNKDDLRRVYELCKKEYFDEYILFWPLAHDTPRLPMAVHHALRQLSAATAPALGEIAAQARRLGELESQLDRFTAHGGHHLDAANHSLQQVEAGISAALDRFSSNLSEGTHGRLVEIKDREGFQKEINRIKAEEIEQRFKSYTAAVQPVRKWASTLKNDLSPQLESIRVLKQFAADFKPTILIVEDDVFQHGLLRKILADLDLQLIFATSSTEALTMLRKQRPDLILMDVGLPDIDGIEATRRLKSVEHFKKVPVIMITGHSEKITVVESLKAGAADFAVKPFDKDTLLEKVQNFLQTAHI